MDLVRVVSVFCRVDLLAKTDLHAVEANEQSRATADFTLRASNCTPRWQACCFWAMGNASGSGLQRLSNNATPRVKTC